MAGSQVQWSPGDVQLGRGGGGGVGEGKGESEGVLGGSFLYLLS